MAALHPLAGTNLLLVEDDSSIRSALTDLLRDEGMRVTEASNGKEALRELRTSAPPDVVLLDLMMPIMDGWEFRVEQKSDALLASIPIIAMSADLSAKARAIAADAYVAKPIDFDELLRQVQNVVANASRQKAAAANRMAALGTLAAGISHEVNNPLSYVLANLQHLKEKLAEISPNGTPTITARDVVDMKETVTDALEGAERIRHIIRQAQRVALPVDHTSRTNNVGLRQVLDEAFAVTEDAIKQRGRLTIDLGATELHVRGEKEGLRHLFVNLLSNAIAALPENRPLDNEVRVRLQKMPSGEALIEIADTGEGISPVIQERIFQPFFTTKPVGQGTGLGLATCRAIVAALGGDISFTSAEGAGTTFRVLLPTAQPQPSSS